MGKIPGRNRWLIILLVFVILLCSIAVAGWLLLKHYYSMMNIQTDDNTQIEQTMPISGSLDENPGAQTEFAQGENVAASEEPEPSENTEETIGLFDDMEVDERIFSIMLIGVDSRDDSDEGRSDSMILFNINPDTKKVIMTSFLRDIYVDIPSFGGDRLNTSYAVGGANLLSKTISRNFGIDVDKYVTLNFWTVRDIIDAFGGVDIDVTEAEIEVLNSYLGEHNFLLNKPFGTDYLSPEDAGMIHLNGSQALAYARIRYIGSDFARTGRQREIISVCMEKLKEMSIFEINDMLEQFLPSVSTNLTEQDVLTLLFMALRIKDYSTESMAIPVDGTWEYANVEGMSVIKANFAANAKAWYNKIMGE